VGFIEELASRLGAMRRCVTLVVPDETAITISVRNDVAIRTTIPALDGAWLVAQIGDSGMPPDAETGEAPFDRAWRITTDAPELAPLVLSEPVRSALDATRTTDHGPIETAVQLTLRAGELELLRQDGDRSVSRALAAVEAVRAVARRPQEIRDEIAGAVVALGGRATSAPWSWATGFAAAVPCGRLAAMLAQRLEGGRSVVALVAEGAVAAAWGEIRRRDLADAVNAWRWCGLDGMVVVGNAAPFADTAAIAEIWPSSIVVGTPGRDGPSIVQMLPSGQALVVDPVTGRYSLIDVDPQAASPRPTGAAAQCEIRWNGWVPPRPALQRAVRWMAATLAQAVPDSPYR